LSPTADYQDLSYDVTPSIRKANRPYTDPAPVETLRALKGLRESTSQREQIIPVVGEHEWTAAYFGVTNRIYIMAGEPGESKGRNLLLHIVDKETRRGEKGWSSRRIWTETRHGRLAKPEESRVVSLGHRVMWALLTLLALTAGALAGASFSIEGYWLAPSSALLGLLGVLVLAATLFALGEGTNTQDGSH